MMNKRDIEALQQNHRYFDYNLNFKDKSSGKTMYAVKVHYPALNLSGLLLKLGWLDESLLSILETIRISQNKNDHEGILQCLVWLQQFLGLTGNRDQERMILEHILVQSN